MSLQGKLDLSFVMISFKLKLLDTTMNKEKDHDSILISNALSNLQLQKNLNEVLSYARKRTKYILNSAIKKWLRGSQDMRNRPHKNCSMSAGPTNEDDKYLEKICVTAHLQEICRINELALSSY